MHDERMDGLRAEIARLAGRIGHLTGRAQAIEQGDTDEREKFDPEGALLGIERTSRVNHNSAVAYWKEVREADKRLDDLRTQLRVLEDAALGEPIEVHITFAERGEEEPHTESTDGN